MNNAFLLQWDDRNLSRLIGIFGRQIDIEHTGFDTVDVCRRSADNSFVFGNALARPQFANGWLRGDSWLKSGPGISNSV